MDDKNLMQDILLLEKGACDLYMHGTIESSTQNIHQTFQCALTDSLKMQDKLYQEMSANGWYPMEQVQEQKVEQTKQKFSMQAQA